MKRRSIRVFLLFAALAAPAAVAVAGGAWVFDPGDGSFNLGYSRKHSASSWDAFGEQFDNPSQHDFRYTYLDGDVGLFRNLSAQFLLTFLDGREGPPGEHERNVGFSDAWFGLKYQLRRGAYPMALGASLRTPMFYDREGPYNRYVFDNQGRDRRPERRVAGSAEVRLLDPVLREPLVPGRRGVGELHDRLHVADRIARRSDSRGGRGGLPAAVVRSGGQGPGPLGLEPPQRLAAAARRPVRRQRDLQLQRREHGTGRRRLDHPDPPRAEPQLERGGRLQQVGLGPLRARRTRSRTSRLAMASSSSPSHREESPRSNRAAELRDAGARPQRTTRRAVEAGSPSRAPVRSRSFARERDVTSETRTRSSRKNCRLSSARDLPIPGARSCLRSPGTARTAS